MKNPNKIERHDDGRPACDEAGVIARAIQQEARRQFEVEREPSLEEFTAPLALFCSVRFIEPTQERRKLPAGSQGDALDADLRIACAAHEALMKAARRYSSGGFPPAPIVTDALEALACYINDSSSNKYMFGWTGDAIERWPTGELRHPDRAARVIQAEVQRRMDARPEPGGNDDIYFFMQPLALFLAVRFEEYPKLPPPPAAVLDLEVGRRAHEALVRAVQGFLKRRSFPPSRVMFDALYCLACYIENPMTHRWNGTSWEPDS